MPANDHCLVIGGPSAWNCDPNRLPEEKRSYCSNLSPPSLSPPSSPPCSPTDLRGNCLGSTHTGHQSETTMNDAGAPSSTELPKDLHATKQAVCEMDIPEHIVDLALKIHYIRHHQYPSVIELFEFASEIANSPDLQCHLFRQLHAHELEEEARESEEPSSLDSLEEDGMEVEEESVDGLKPCTDEVDCAAPALESLSAEMPASPKKDNAAPSIATQMKRLEQLNEENRKLKNRKVCRVCRKVELAVSGITFLPCGHFITCEECAEKCDDCPACGKSIMGTVRTFLA